MNATVTYTEKNNGYLSVFKPLITHPAKLFETIFPINGADFSSFLRL